MNKKMVSLTAGIIFLFLWYPNCTAEDMKYYRPLKIKESPIIDGDLTEGCWQKAKRVSDFIPHVMDGKPATQQSIVSICYDEKNLYIGVEYFESNINQLVKTFTKHDESIWTDDCLEIFIAPDYLKKEHYFHFIANCIGTQLEEKTDIAGRNMGWDDPWQAKTKIEKDRWFVEVAIPFSSLEIKPTQQKDLWGMSICRERWAGEKEYSCWPIGGSFHNPSGHLLFTSYRAYLVKEVFPSWEKERQEIYKFLKPGFKVEKRFQQEVEKLIKPVELAKRRLIKKELTTSEEFNAFIQKMAESIKKIREIKPQIEFACFLTQLKGFFKE